MYLRELEIKNYRSLEDVKLEKLDKFNILIGRNNSGKSAIFGALSLLNDSVFGKGIDWDSSLTARDSKRSLDFRLLFEARPQDRSEFIRILAAELPEARRHQMQYSSLFRHVEFNFKRAAYTGGPLHLRETKLMMEDGKWGTIQKMESKDESVGNPSGNFANLREIANNQPLLGSGHLNRFTMFQLNYHFGTEGLSGKDEATVWPLKRLADYLKQAFFFTPFRHSVAQSQASEYNQLDQNGSNLAQVLLTTMTKDTDRFFDIENFLLSALPDIGRLQTPLASNMTEVSFRAKDGNYPVHLHNMGGGIEQLLMIATVLHTTGDESTLFLEEPESHLHPGAQRFLIERLNQGNRQVFVTTHSPTFVNSPHSKSIYQVKLVENRTTIKRIGETNSLSEMLEDIGSRNSDVLLSDAVLFVEGTGDQQVIETWSESLGISLEERNITVLPMGGSEGFDRTARIRSEVLEGISRRAPVPHLFILDRDERSHSDIERIQTALDKRAYFLNKRELENYLLVPRAIL